MVSLRDESTGGPPFPNGCFPAMEELYGASWACMCTMLPEVWARKKVFSRWGHPCGLSCVGSCVEYKLWLKMCILSKHWHDFCMHHISSAILSHWSFCQGLKTCKVSHPCVFKVAADPETWEHSYGFSPSLMFDEGILLQLRAFMWLFPSSGFDQNALFPPKSFFHIQCICTASLTRVTSHV